MTSNNDPVIADNPDSEFKYEVPPRTDATVLLLTKHGVCVPGEWRGKYGQYFIGWAPMPKRNKQREKELGLL
jgi:hypothetical protein